MMNQQTDWLCQRKQNLLDRKTERDLGQHGKLNDNNAGRNVELNHPLGKKVMGGL
jgi:hypothetical protein